MLMPGFGSNTTKDIYIYIWLNEMVFWDSISLCSPSEAGTHPEVLAEAHLWMLVDGPVLSNCLEKMISFPEKCNCGWEPEDPLSSVLQTLMMAFVQNENKRLNLCFFFLVLWVLTSLNKIGSRKIVTDGGWTVIERWTFIACIPALYVSGNEVNLEEIDKVRHS